MLSKVISRRDAGRAHAIVFPALTPGPAGNVTEQAASRGSDEVAALREKLRQLELRTTAQGREAFDAGLRQGDQQARAELVPVITRLNSAIAEITAMRGDLRRRAEGDVVQLALLIAKRVLHRQLSVDEGALTAIARVAFERLTRSESYTVTVHPQFAAAFKSALPGNQASRVHIEPDPDCEPGTLVIHSAEGVIDASVDAQLEEISRGLTDRIASKP
jgi:flagellar assembly protein FliH